LGNFFIIFVFSLPLSFPERLCGFEHNSDEVVEKPSFFLFSSSLVLLATYMVVMVVKR